MNGLQVIQDFFRLQGIVKSTVSGVFEDLKFKISEGMYMYFVNRTKALELRYVLIKVYLVDIWDGQNLIQTTKSGILQCSGPKGR